MTTYDKHMQLLTLLQNIQALSEDEVLDIENDFNYHYFWGDFCDATNCKIGTCDNCKNLFFDCTLLNKVCRNCKK